MRLKDVPYKTAKRKTANVLMPKTMENATSLYGEGLGNFTNAEEPTTGASNIGPDAGAGGKLPEGAS